MEIFEKLKELIEKSPLGFIEGDYRFLELTPEKWIDWKEKGFTDFYPDEERAIAVSVGKEFLGKFVVQKEDVLSIETEKNGDFLMRLSFIHENKRPFITMFLHCKDSFPNLNEFGRFNASIPKYV